MFKFSLVEFSIRRPKLVVWATVALVLLFLTQFPRIKIGRASCRERV